MVDFIDICDVKQLANEKGSGFEAHKPSSTHIPGNP
jgi:hypothetical protein